MRASLNLVSVIAAGFVAFFGGLLMLVMVLILWLLGVVSTLMLMVSAFGGVMYMFTGRAHDAHVAIVYLGYGAVPFVLAFVFHYYRAEWTGGPRRRRALTTGMRRGPRSECGIRAIKVTF